MCLRAPSCDKSICFVSSFKPGFKCTSHFAKRGLSLLFALLSYLLLPCTVYLLVLVTVSHFIILVVDIATLFSISIFPTTRLPAVMFAFVYSAALCCPPNPTLELEPPRRPRIPFRTAHRRTTRGQTRQLPRQAGTLRTAPPACAASRRPCHRGRPTHADTPQEGGCFACSAC